MVEILIAGMLLSSLLRIYEIKIRLQREKFGGVERMKTMRILLMCMVHTGAYEQT